MKINTLNFLVSLLGTYLFQALQKGLIGEGCLEERGLNKFLESFQWLAKYFLLDNKEKYSDCLVYTSLVHGRTNKIEKLCSNR